MTSVKTRLKQGIRLIAVAAAVAIAGSYFTPLAQPSAEAAGTNYYVDSVAGSDSNPGTSSSTPWKSLSPVNSRTFQAGDTVNFKRGSSWSTTLTAKGSGSSSAPITFQAYGTGNAPVVSGASAGQYGHSIDIYGSYVVVQDFLAKDGKEAGIFIRTGTNGVQVVNNEVSNSGVGVYVLGGNSLVKGNYLHDLTMIVNDTAADNDYGAEGVWLSNVSNVEVSYNKFVNCRASSYDYGTDGGAVEVWGNVTNANIHHNYSKGSNGMMEVGGGALNGLTFAYNVSDGDYYDLFCFHIGGNFAASFSNIKIDNNTIIMKDTASSVIDSSGSALPSSVYFRNNIVYSAERFAYGGGFSHSNNLYYFTNGAGLGSISLGSGEKIANPNFVNYAGGDYHLTSSSPAINAGASLGYSTDFAGSSLSGAPDLGAYEFGGTVPAATANAVPTTAPPAPTTPPATATSAPTTPPATATSAPTTPPATATPAPTTPPATSTPAAGATPVASTSGLSANWGFNEGTGTTAADLSGNKLNSTLYSGATWLAGRYGKAAGFNGSSSYGMVPDNNLLSPLAGGGNMTVSAWVNLSQLPAASGQGRAPVLAKGSANNWEYGLYVYSNGALSFNIWNLNGNNYAEAKGGTLALNGWHNIVATAKRGGFVRLYVDGKIVSDVYSGLSGSVGNGTSPLYFGRRGDGQYLKANVDDVRIYNRILSATEITGLAK